MEMEDGTHIPFPDLFLIVSLEDGFCIMATSLVDKDGEALQGADLGQICADIRANGDGYIDGGEEYILIDKAVSIVRDGGRE